MLEKKVAILGIGAKTAPIILLVQMSIFATLSPLRANSAISAEVKKPIIIANNRNYNWLNVVPPNNIGGFYIIGNSYNTFKC